MMLEGYIALVLLVALVVVATIRWADGAYQNARREQRLDREGERE